MNLQTRFIFTSIVALSVAFLSSCGKEGEQVNPLKEPAAIKQLSEIQATPDRTTLDNRKVELASVAVGDVVGTYTFWAGDSSIQIPVVRGDRLKGPVEDHVRKGERVSLNGIIKRVPNPIPTKDTQWSSLNDKERADIASASIYILAERVSVIK